MSNKFKTFVWHSFVCMIWYTKIKLGDDENTIALVGPTRMDYEKAVNAIEYIKNELTKYFEEKKK